MARMRLEYWEKWGGREWEAMAGIVRLFNEAQKKYEVVMVPAGDWSASSDVGRFLDAQRQRTTPDVIGLEDHQIADLAAQKALISLEELVKPSQLARTEYQQPFLDLGKYEEELYGVPVVGDIVTLYVNLAAVQGTRFEMGRIPLDLWEFDAGLEEMRAQGRVGFIPTCPGWWPQAWVWFFGGSWFDDRGRFAPALPANVRSYEWVSSFRRRWNLGAFAAPLNPVGAREPDPFLKGEIAMVLEGDWLVQRMVQTPGLDWWPAPFPTLMKRPAALIVADVLSIPRGGRHPEGAAEFVVFAAQPERIEQLALGQMKISPLRHWSDSFIARHRNPRLRLLREILSSSQLFCDPHVAGWMSYLERIKGAFGLVWSGQDTPTRALKAIEEAD